MRERQSERQAEFFGDAIADGCVEGFNVQEQWLPERSGGLPDVAADEPLIGAETPEGHIHFPLVRPKAHRESAEFAA